LLACPAVLCTYGDHNPNFAFLTKHFRVIGKTDPNPTVILQRLQRSRPAEGLSLPYKLRPVVGKTQDFCA
ncbi:MAG: hypothetical protein SGJ20_07725, partial [Planctomycetota bacterium]|nr:hypothetical protein [Planctomycetota bacterium]